MRIALAQIDMRLGDIEGICARIEDQARLAASQGASLICTPVPLFGGMMPGALLEAKNYEHALLSSLTGLAARLDALSIQAVVPAPVAIDHTPLFEVFLLKEGRVVPLRSLFAARRAGSAEDLWLPPVFDIEGLRVAVTFDAVSDLKILPPGCDLALFLQASSFDVGDESTSCVASVADGHFAPLAKEKSVWLACMAPIGGYDEAAFTGGSFFMDDAGRVVAAAPCFSEALLVQDIERGMVLSALEAHELPHYQREEWLWEALRLHLADSVRALGSTSVVVALTGDLPSSLTALLAVDALGPRNVTGLFVERSQVLTPAQESAEHDRADRVRELASSLGIRLIERAPADAAHLLDRDAPGLGLALARERIEGLYLEDVAIELGAVAVSSITKTDAALAAPLAAAGYLGAVAPFGDVYLTALEFLARARSRAGSAIPARLITLNAVEDRMASILAASIAGAPESPVWRERMARLLAPLEAAQIDGVLEAHVDHGLSQDEIPLAATAPDAVALLLMIVRAGEVWRRRLPLAPMVSSRSFPERRWPAQLAWSDTGRGGEDPLTCAGLVSAESERVLELGEEHGRRVRGEIVGLIAGMLGVPVDDMDEDEVESELLRRMREAFEADEGGQNPPFAGGRPHGFTFFSQN